MMDPFSITVGIVSLVSLAAQTLSVTKTYVDEVRHGKEAAAELLRELDVLHFNLLRLDRFLNNKTEAVPSFDDTSVLVSSTYACRNKLTALHDKLDAPSASRLSRLKWPLSSKEHMEAIQELRAFAQWIQFALTVDGCALLSKTSAEVLNTLKHQLETFQLVESIGHRTRSIERSLEEQVQISRDARVAKEREKVLNWISTIKHEQKHHDVRMPRVDGTGEWLLQEKEFQRWRDEPRTSNNVLWCHGIQGSGKSVLASLVVDRLRDDFFDQNIVIAHLYFDYRDQGHQKIENEIASLLKQLAMAKPELPQSVLELYQRLKGLQRQPQQQDLEQAILTTYQNFVRVFIVIDALDECDANNKRKGFISFLENMRNNSDMSFFVTSRPHPEDIRKLLESCSNITIKADDSDLRRYISREIERSDTVDELDEDFKEDIIEKVVQGAGEMFLLAVLQVQAILNEPTAGEMEEALVAMPRGLNDAFEETLQRIQKQPDGRKRIGLNALMWISHARRPLLVKELSEALAIKPGDKAVNPKYKPSQKLMVACCLGLATIDEESSVIRLVHYSVQEYFREHQNRIFPFGEREVAGNLITYLLFDSFALGCRQKKREISALIGSHKLVKYAARHWGYHVRNAGSKMIDKLALKLLRAAPQRASSVQISQYSRGRREEYWNAEEGESRNGLHIAAAFGLEELAKQMLDSGECDVDSATKMGTTALIEAAASGHQGFIQLLLHEKADLTAENWYGTALHCAAESGKVVAISELLNRELDVDIRDSRGRTALHCATISAHTHAMQVLLKAGAEVNAICHEQCTPLHYAVVLERPLEVVRFLLVNGANTEKRSRSRLTVLHHAARMNSEEVLILLLDHGAEVDAKHTHGGTALHFAAERTADDEGLTPLHLATKKNHENIVRKLLDAGADVNGRSKDGGTALGFAFEKGHGGIAQLLLQHGAERQLGPQQYWLIDEE